MTITTTNPFAPGRAGIDFATFERRLDRMLRHGEIDETDEAMLLAAFSAGDFDTIEAMMGPMGHEPGSAGVGMADASVGVDSFGGATTLGGWAELRDLAAAGIIDPGVVAGIEEAVMRQDHVAIRGWIDALEDAESGAAVFGGDGDVRAVRAALAGEIGETLPAPEGLIYAVPGTPADEHRTGYDSHPQINAYVPRTPAVLSIDAEYRDPNLLAGAEEGLLFDRFGRPLDAGLIVGHSSIDSGNRGADPQQLVTILNRLGVEVRPSIPITEDGMGGWMHLDGRPLTGEEFDYVIGEWTYEPTATTHGVTMRDENGRPTTIVYAQNMDHPQEGGSLYDVGDREAVILHEAGHALYLLMSQESRDRLMERPDLQELFDNINSQGPASDPIDEYLADAFRAYLTNPGWFKTHYPGLADAIAEEVNATPLFQGVIQFN
ncbi:MAG: hypothetical protein IT534_13285 [Bauldia sp.]|nr:hypothetical protein [Bauldia sp.]